MNHRWNLSFRVADKLGADGGLHFTESAKREPGPTGPRCESSRFARSRYSISRIMASQISQPTEEAKLGVGTLAKKRSWRIGFFTVMPGVILLLVLMGFTRTLYARPLFRTAPIPPYLYVHGIVLTSWFAWAWAQSLLISAERIANHRRSGTVGACFAAVVFAAALMASLGVVSRKGFDLNASASVTGIGIRRNYGRAILFERRVEEYLQRPELRFVCGGRCSFSAASPAPRTRSIAAIVGYFSDGDPRVHLSFRTAFA